MTQQNDDLIRQHYRTQAEKAGSSPLSTIGERVIREKEVRLIKSFLELVRRNSGSRVLRVLDAGCGNGYTLGLLAEDRTPLELFGLEFTNDLLAIARERNLEGCVLDQGDIRQTRYEDAFFDVVYTERCLINLLDYQEQLKAVREIARILKPSGYYLMLECFTDGLENNNKARREMGLQQIDPAYHNLYFEKETLFRDIRQVFRVVDPAEVDAEEGSTAIPSNFLSSHYFVARILHPLITKGEWVPNTEFVKFFSFLPPVGNYGPLQAFVLRKPGEG
jgi:ubiquinone/menaquinone biosynthesis C-methylase UbiE